MLLTSGSKVNGTTVCSPLGRNLAAGLYGNFFLYSWNRPLSSSCCRADFPLFRGILSGKINSYLETHSPTRRKDMSDLITYPKKEFRSWSDLGRENRKINDRVFEKIKSLSQRRLVINGWI